jgi:hypothetical protein
MQNLAKLIRIEPAFDYPDMVRALFERYAPYRTIAEYIPRRPEQPAVPYFRGNWAVGGKPLVDGPKRFCTTLGSSMRRGRYLGA